jgi:hypothetical protein
MSPGNNPSAHDLEAIGIKYRLPVYWLEEIALCIRGGAADTEVRSTVQRPAGREAQDAQTIPLTDADCRLVIAEIRALMSD